MAAAESMASGAQARQRVNAAFPHGVASGDPTADAVVCVTRANPPSCGVTVQLRWPVALDPRAAGRSRPERPSRCRSRTEQPRRSSRDRRPARSSPLASRAAAASRRRGARARHGSELCGNPHKRPTGNPAASPQDVVAATNLAAGAGACLGACRRSRGAPNHMTRRSRRDGVRASGEPQGRAQPADKEDYSRTCPRPSGRRRPARRSGRRRTAFRRRSSPLLAGPCRTELGVCCAMLGRSSRAGRRAR